MATKIEKFNLGILDDYHVPRTCEECGGVMIFKGVGEYHCEKCAKVAYDDYGKVRLFLEKNPGATAMTVEQATGVSQKLIRQMLKESRLQVAEGSRTFLHCEACGKEIRSGIYCSECETKVHRNLEDQQRKINNSHMQGVAMGQKGEEGQKRFQHDWQR